MILIALDIGNTNISLGVFEGEGIRGTFSFRAHPEGDPLSYYKKKFVGVLRSLKRNKIEAVVISSVIPLLLPTLKEAAGEIFKVSTYVLGEEIQPQIENLYRKPCEVGMDRLANAVGGFYLYGGPLIVVDFGTAITFDVIGGRGEYIGGMIAPGVRLSLDALSQKAVLLPEIELEETPAPGLIGKDTKESMKSGIFYGFASLVDGIIKHLKKELKREINPVKSPMPQASADASLARRTSKGIKVIATGGDARAIIPFCKEVDEIDPHLTIRGVMLIYGQSKATEKA